MPAPVLRLLCAAAPETFDAELLARFRSERDEAAFTELVRRHGPSVWRVCRRLVGDSSADDAFQATFLILACRFGSKGRVDRELARRSRGRGGPANAQTRSTDGTLGKRLTDRASTPQLHCSVESVDLAAILDDELTRLPDHLCDPVVLYLLHGKTQDQAAGELGPDGTADPALSVSMERSVLAARLKRRKMGFENELR
jgi:DNA-directed RNA polymerase specialized sigma24 family protein